MFAFIRGTLIEASLTFAIIEANGIGYKLFLPANLLPRLPQMGQQTLLHTSFVIRECSQALYGFLTSQDRDLFEGLLNVSGIGPKTALNLIGHMTLQELQSAVTNSDIKALSKVPGIGKKSAERLIVEMRDKISHFFSCDPSTLAVQMPLDPRMQTINDAMSALIHLGYNQLTAQKAIKKSIQEFPEEKKIELSALITTALKHV